MYGLPANIDLSFMHDKPLQQVCIGENEAILRFGDDVTLTIQSKMAHRSAGVVTAVYKKIVPSAPMLASLINATIKKASALPPGTLVLELSNGDALEVYDDSQQFESYQIRHGKDLIVV